MQSDNCDCWSWRWWWRIRIISDEIPPYGEKINKFRDYVFNTWITNVNFPIALWNHFNADGPRTNNHVEGFHSRINKYTRIINFYTYYIYIYIYFHIKSSTSTHPNIWKFIEIIQDDEFKQNLKKIRLDASFLVVRGRNKVDVARDLQIEKFKNNLLQKEISLKDFLIKLGEKVVKNYESM